MSKYKYKALNTRGRPVRGVVEAVSEADLYATLQKANLELISCSSMSEGGSLLSGISLPGLGSKSLDIRDMIQFFVYMEQMQGAGVSLLETLADIRDTTDNPTMRDIVSQIYRDVSEGSSLSEAMGRHPKTFTALYISLISAGEETGDLTSAYMQLVKYLKWVDDMQTKVRKATRYPMIVSVVVVLTISLMMGVVVPQVVGFMDNMNQELPWYTTSLMATSEFFVAYWWGVLLAPIILFILYKVARASSEDIAFQFDTWWLNMPKVGDLIRKISIARFAQTFGALFASGIDVLQGLEAAQKTVTNLAVIQALEGVRQNVKDGEALSSAFKASGEFPSMVVSMLKVGEESGKLTEVLDQVSDFYTKDVDETIQGLISSIEPMLTLVLGGMMLWIAAGVFGPIYNSFEDLPL